MSILSNLFSWAKNSGVLAAAQKEAAAEVSQAVQSALATATQHAPDMQEPLQAAAQSMISLALAGIATKAK